MEDRLAQGYVLTLHLAADQISGDIGDQVIRELSHLSAVRGPTLPGNLLLHCTVSATSEGDAVRYVAQRTITALMSAGVETPRVLSVEASLVDHVAV
jgi:hypothetical protein